LDQEDIQKIQRMLSLKYHPDRGGDPKKMAQINEILNKVKGK
jgi:curved DNA-binding protein CbpA